MRLLDRIFLGLIGGISLLRLLIETSLNSFGPLGSFKLSNLTVDNLLLASAFLFFLKKTYFKEKIVLPAALKALIVFGGLATISIFYSLDKPVSLLASLDLWSYILLIIVLVNLLDRKRLKVMAFFLIGIGIIASIQAFYEYFVQLPWYVAHVTPQMLDGHRDLAQLIQTHRTPTLFLWPNTMTGFLIMVIPLTVAWLLDTKRTRNRIVLAIGAAILFYALFIELSMSSCLGLLLGFTVGVMLAKNYVKPNAYRHMITVLGVLVLFSTVVAFKKIGFSNANSFSSRQEFFHDAFYLIRQHPLIGNGWSAFATASAPLARSINGFTAYAHNSCLQIAAELGIVGFLSFIFFLFFLGKQALNLSDRYPSWFPLGILVGLLACFVDNFFSYTMLLPVTAFYWWTIVGMFLSCQKEGPDVRTPIKIMLIIATFGLGIVACRLERAEYDYFKALPYLHANTNQEEALGLFQEAGNLNPLDKKFELAEAVVYDQLYNRTGDRKFLSLAGQTVAKTQGQVSLGAERQALEDNIKAAQ